jgi:hypothetical protein
MSEPIIYGTCCDMFMKITHNFRWFVDPDGNFCMPCLPENNRDELIRLNFCPSCGKEVRMIVIPKNELKL